ncbi:MAG: hypothetical protein KAT39_02995 [Alphaproteobacteria bacterium]|nr:hypothetical protein [Alphaproteobacteria bacterium]
MNLARLAEILDAYGADARRWPASERVAAEALIAESTEAVALREAAAALDSLMDASVAPVPSPELMARVLAAREPGANAGWFAILWPFGPVWQPVSAMAAAAVLGIAIGAVAPNIVIPDYGDSAIAEVESLALGPTLNLDYGL